MQIAPRCRRECSARQGELLGSRRQARTGTASRRANVGDKGLPIEGERVAD